MFPYYIIFIFLAFSSFSEALYLKYQQKILLLIIIWFVLTVFAGLRYDNPDWGAYYSFYEEIATGSGRGSSDIGFNLLCKLLSLFSNNPIVMFIIVAGLAIGLNLNSFRKYSSSFLICTLFYFVHLYVLREMIQIRAGLASAICLFSIRFLADKNYTKFVFVWLLAISIHFSAIIFGFVYFFRIINPPVRRLKYLLLACLVIGLIYPFGQILKKIVGLEGIDMGRINDYVAYGDEKYGNQLGIFSNINTVKYLMICSLLFLFNKKLSRVNKYYSVILYSYVIGVCWLLLFNDFSIIGARLSNILTSVEPILISYICLLFAPNSKWCYTTLVILFALIILMYNMGPDKVVPYQFYFT